MDKYDPRPVVYGPAVFSIVWAPNWWRKPGYQEHVDAVFAAINDPGYRLANDKPIPPPPSGTDLRKVRRLKLAKPWTYLKRCVNG